MIPNPNCNFPECWAEYSLAAKKKKANEIYAQLPPTSLFETDELMDRCQGDFKLASLVAYKIAAAYYKDNVPLAPFTEELNKIGTTLLPVHYCGGDMCFGRVFSINHCAFSSHDSIIGFRNSEKDWPQKDFKILKGLKFIGPHGNWVLFKLDRNATDDMTGMLYSDLEKNFTIEFAHFPHDGEKRFVYRWEDC